MDQIDLPDEQMDKLRQFQEITNIDDLQVAICKLASLDWNVQRAIEAHLMPELDDNEEPVILEAPPSRPAPSSAPSYTQNMSRRRPRHNDRAQAPEPEPLHSASVGMNSNNSNDHGAVTRTRTTRNAFSERGPSSSARNATPPEETAGDDEMRSDDDDMYIDDGHDMEADVVSASRRVEGLVPLIPLDSSDVHEALQNFVAVFENRYRASGNMPHFSTESLPDAIRAAFDKPESSDRRPLAIYIHNEKSIAANIFVTQVLCTEVISSLLRHQFVLWPWDVTYEENANKLREWLELTHMSDVISFDNFKYVRSETFPMIAVVVRDKGSFIPVQMCCGTDSMDSVLSKLMSGIDAYEAIRVQEQTEKREREEREAIRNQQHAEYEESLAADKARMEAKKREEEEKRAKEEEERRKEEAEKIRRETLAKKLPSEPTESEQDVMQVKFRLPTGEQTMRRFRRKEPIQVMVDYLSSKGFSPALYKYFNSDYPKKEVNSHFDLTQSFFDAKWPAREQIHVEEI
ncbi:unnamed protein product [Caenorhabditis auriculariae]|uniref:UBX domain-containing protein n=1 Tax=Caenorhabditis auriculariae TaxID=2777116 RepID=A0A8S1HC49_9PELO|nr:unnamed protein product [Caenorhabditis auriculariae]